MENIMLTKEENEVLQASDECNAMLSESTDHLTLEDEFIRICSKAPMPNANKLNLRK